MHVAWQCAGLPTSRPNRSARVCACARAGYARRLMPRRRCRRAAMRSTRIGSRSGSLGSPSTVRQRSATSTPRLSQHAIETAACGSLGSGTAQVRTLASGASQRVARNPPERPGSSYPPHLPPARALDCTRASGQLISSRPTTCTRSPSTSRTSTSSSGSRTPHCLSSSPWCPAPSSAGARWAPRRVAPHQAVPRCASRRRHSSCPTFARCASERTVRTGSR